MVEHLEFANFIVAIDFHGYLYGAINSSDDPVAILGRYGEFAY